MVLWCVQGVKVKQSRPLKCVAPSTFAEKRRCELQKRKVFEGKLNSLAIRAVENKHDRNDNTVSSHNTKQESRQEATEEPTEIASNWCYIQGTVDDDVNELIVNAFYSHTHLNDAFRSTYFVHHLSLSQKNDELLIVLTS